MAPSELKFVLQVPQPVVPLKNAVTSLASPRRPDSQFLLPPEFSAQRELLTNIQL